MFNNPQNVEYISLQDFSTRLHKINRIITFTNKFHVKNNLYFLSLLSVIKFLYVQLLCRIIKINLLLFELKRSFILFYKYA